MRIGVKSVLLSICAWAIITRSDQCSSCNADESLALLQLRKDGSDPDTRLPDHWNTVAKNISLLGETDGAARKAHLGGRSFQALEASREQQAEFAMTNCTASKWIFIWSTGRAGSTTVMSMLNHLPGVYLSGENEALAESIEQLAYRTLSLKEHGSNSENGAWFNRPDEEAITAAARMWICALRSDAPRGAGYRGFKELASRSLGQIHVMRELFPDAYHILNFRKDLTAQTQSNFHAYYNDTEEMLLQHLEDMRNAAYGANVFELPLEEFSPEKFNEMIGWLGMETNCRFTSVIHQNNGQTSDGYGEDTRDPLTCSQSKD
jgi:hypothetical protein